MLKTIKRYKRTSKKEQFLRNLVAAYASPWAKRRGTFRDLEETQNRRNARLTEARFEEDRKEIIKQWLAAMQGNPDAVTRQALELFNEPLDQTAGRLEPKTAINIILNQIIEADRNIFFYERDFIEDIAGVVNGRYIATNGTTDTNKSLRFLKALWLFCGEAMDDFDIKLLPDKLRNLLGADHPYKPTRYTQRETLQRYIPDLAEEFIHLKASENPRRYVEINTEFFRVINAQATDKYEERDISLIYGYENNYHLTLRTIVGLIGEGAITADDPVLIMGPRYADEVLFFRNILGLKKTVGLDLRDEGDVIVSGDMHAIPFPDNHFRLIYGASVFEYAYDFRKVVDEMARVLQRPGYVATIHRTNRTNSPSSTQRSDFGCVEAATGAFHPFRHTILAQDEGISGNPDAIGNFPSYVLRLDS